MDTAARFTWQPWLGLRPWFDWQVQDKEKTQIKEKRRKYWQEKSTFLYPLVQQLAFSELNLGQGYSMSTYICYFK